MSNKRSEAIIRLSNLLNNISDPRRKAMLGDKIDNILSKYFDRISSDKLAASIVSRYGSESLNSKYGVFQSIIDSFDKEDLLSLSKFLSLDNDYDTVKSSIDSKLKLFLEYFKQSSYFLTKKEKDKRVTHFKISLDYGATLKSLGFPHPYQNRVKLELEDRINNHPNGYSTLIVMPTGSGKTRTAIEFMIDFIRSKLNSNILWVVESPQLSEQSLNSFVELWRLRGDRELDVYRCFNNFTPSNNVDFVNKTNIIFGAFQKMNSLKDREDSFYQLLSENIDLIIIDEAHFSLAETYENLISDIFNKNKNILKIGLTATPMRQDDNEFYGLKNYFNKNIVDFKDEKHQTIEDPLKYLQNEGYLSQIEIEYLNIPKSEIYESSKEFNDKVIERIISSVNQDKQIIVFARSKYHAIALDILLKDKKIKSECVVGETSTYDRQLFFKCFEFQKGHEDKVNVLINFDILATGIDLPKVDELFLLRKFGNHTTAMQVLGRALRGFKNGGNKMNKVISVKSNEEIVHDPSNLYNLIKNMY
ncbi:MAG: hypothetical protein CMD58_02730 [Gammaproteobacteria bacterium]|nr:hypothetical protein [Gammaproteobacteria bacterium]|tara:strand:- start:373 stop:1968 length:1596 start_codon:yes stop_codon:yes gene_type:complete